MKQEKEESQQQLTKSGEKKSEGGIQILDIQV